MQKQTFKRDPNAGPVHQETTGVAQTLLAFLELIHSKHHGGVPIDHHDLFQGLARVYAELTGVRPLDQLVARSDAYRAAVAEVSRGD